MARYVAVTGCAGFIGRVVTTALLERGDYVYGVDAMTYAADPAWVNFISIRFPTQFSFIGRPVEALDRLPDVDAVFHLAAETHVDNSLTDGQRFVRTNVGGTCYILELIRAKAQHGMPQLIHVSTDEVYGTITEGLASEDSILTPTSPYAASKAGADQLVQAWGKTYGVPFVIARPTNCYGAGQYPEKLIPKIVRSIGLGRSVTVHGDGTQTRYWLDVKDCASALIHLFDHGMSGTYNIGGNTEASVNEVFTAIAKALGCGDARSATGFVRPAMDGRYAVDDAKLRASGWTPKGDFWRDLPTLVQEESRRFRF